MRGWREGGEEGGLGKVRRDVKKGLELVFDFCGIVWKIFGNLI